MVNQLFANNFVGVAGSEFGAALGGPVNILAGGERVDHDQGLARSMAAHVVPFFGEKYTATEFIHGYIPIRNSAMPYLFFQIPVLDVRGTNIPGVGHFGAVANAPIPETYITPLVGWSYRFLPLSAFPDESVKPKQVFNAKQGWSPFLEAINNDKATTKAINPTWAGVSIGKYQVKIDVGRLTGMHQAAPYKGRTLLTLQTVPSQKAKPNVPRFDLRRHYDTFLRIAAHVQAHPQTGEEVGTQMILPSNAAMMRQMFQYVDASVARQQATDRGRSKGSCQEQFT